MWLSFGTGALLVRAAVLGDAAERRRELRVRRAASSGNYVDVAQVDRHAPTRTAPGTGRAAGSADGPNRGDRSAFAQRASATTMMPSSTAAGRLPLRPYATAAASLFSDRSWISFPPIPMVREFDDPVRSKDPNSARAACSAAQPAMLRMSHAPKHGC